MSGSYKIFVVLFLVFKFFIFTCGKIHVTQHLPSWQFLSVEFRSVKYTHIVGDQNTPPQNMKNCWAEDNQEKAGAGKLSALPLSIWKQDLDLERQRASWLLLYQGEQRLTLKITLYPHQPGDDTRGIDISKPFLTCLYLPFICLLPKLLPIETQSSFPLSCRELCSWICPFTSSRDAM